MNSTKSVWKVISLILVLAILCAGFLFLRRTEQVDQNRMRELYAQAEPLQRQREALSAELDSLEFNYALMMRDVSTVQMLFCELDSELFSEVYPLMRDRGVTGVIGISLLDMPGMMGKISADEYKRLVMDHWGSCLVYNSDSPMEYWIPEVKGYLNYRDIEMPKAIYFPNGNYTEEFDAYLISEGITTVIQGASDGHTNTVTDVKEELWHTWAMPWNYTGVANDTQLLAVTDGGNLSFTISFRNLWDAYEKEGFTHTLDSLQPYLVTEDPLEERDSAADSTEEDLEKPLLRVLEYDAARLKHLEANEQNTILDNEFRSRKTELESQIEQLDAQIGEIYEKWQQGSLTRDRDVETLDD